MDYSKKDVVYKEDVIVLTPEEHKKVNEVLHRALILKTPTLKTIDLPPVDHVVLIGGMYRNEFIITSSLSSSSSSSSEDQEKEQQQEQEQSK